MSWQSDALAEDGRAWHEWFRLRPDDEVTETDWKREALDTEGRFGTSAELQWSHIESHAVARTHDEVGTATSLQMTYCEASLPIDSKYLRLRYFAPGAPESAMSQWRALLASARREE